VNAEYPAPGAGNSGRIHASRPCHAVPFGVLIGPEWVVGHSERTPYTALEDSAAGPTSRSSCPDLSRPLQGLIATGTWLSGGLFNFNRLSGVKTAGPGLPSAFHIARSGAQ